MSAHDLFNLKGFTVAEKYVVEDVVSESGYALVYRASDAFTNETVALQVFKVLGEYGEDARKRLLEAFLEQGTRLGELAGPASAIRTPRDIAPLTTRDGKWVPYMAFDWLEGNTLDAVLRIQRRSGAGPQDLGAALAFVEPIVRTLDALHAQGLAHLDIKPGNVLLVHPSDETVRPGPCLLEFGTAHLVSYAFDPQPDAGAVSIAPTYFEPAYAAPEQFVSPGPAKGPWTDVFSLAVLLVEMITGKPAAPNADVGVLATAPRPTPRQLGAPVAAAVEAVFARALAIDPRQRYATAGQFWMAARAALQRSPPEATPRAHAAVPPAPGSAPAAGSAPSSAPPGAPRKQIQTSPDLLREKLEAEEMAQRSPRLVVVTVTLLLVGIAVGLMLSRSSSSSKNADPHRGQVRGAPAQGHS